jgi:Fungal specific transcription factor domain
MFRIRRIKCDETRPRCARCTGTGRNCDGYVPINQSALTMIPGPSTTALTTNDLPGDRLGRRSFDFFRNCSVPNISLHFGSPPWTRLALQASHLEPALQHAAAALGALHEYLESQKCPENLVVTRNTISIDYATQQYTQALTFLRNLLTKSDSQSIELALICALMCMYFEVLQENWQIAQAHLENCLKVLEPLLPSQGSWLTNAVEANMRKSNPIDNDIIQAFAHLDIEASCTLGHRAPSMCIAAATLDIPTPFTSISHARQVLYGLTSQLHSFMRSSADHYRCSIQHIPLPIIAEAHFHQAHLKDWASSFSAFLNDPSTKLSRQEQQGADVLSVQQKVTYMKVATCLYAEETIFDQFDQEFEEILCLADYLIYRTTPPTTNPISLTKKVVLSFDMGIIEALFWTAIKCRSSAIRRRAIEILRKVSWQEGVWNAEMMVAMAERFVEMEEMGMNDERSLIAAGGQEFRIPEWRRFHDHGWEMHLTGRKTNVRAGRRENGMDGGWTWYEEEVAW